jgi:CheY-like chemotaxis protein
MSAPADSRRRVLVVDDEPEVATAISAMLRLKGIDTKTAGSGDEALTALEHERIHVIFTDLKMPGMDGLELCRRIKARNPVACVFAITGFRSLFDLAECREAGFEDYFVKPVGSETLWSAAEHAFERLNRWSGLAGARN